MSDKASDFFNDYLKAYNESDYSKMKNEHSARLEIALRKKEFEENLDAMWDVYKKGYTKQILTYNKQKEYIKSLNIKVFRNSEGKHKLVF